MSAMASQITSLTIVYSTVYSGAYQRKHQSSASLAFLQGIHRWPVNSPHKGPVTRKMVPFDDVTMIIFHLYSLGSIRISLTDFMIHILRKIPRRVDPDNCMQVSVMSDVCAVSKNYQLILISFAFPYNNQIVVIVYEYAPYSLTVVISNHEWYKE